MDGQSSCPTKTPFATQHSAELLISFHYRTSLSKKPVNPASVNDASPYFSEATRVIRVHRSLQAHRRPEWHRDRAARHRPQACRGDLVHLRRRGRAPRSRLQPGIVGVERPRDRRSPAPRLAPRRPASLIPGASAAGAAFGSIAARGPAPARGLSPCLHRRRRRRRRCR